MKKKTKTLFYTSSCAFNVHPNVHNAETVKWAYERCLTEIIGHFFTTNVKIENVTTVTIPGELPQIVVLMTGSVQKEID